jgi:GNAT superfamily N-acetyltransferase
MRTIRQRHAAPGTADVVVRPMRETDLPAADTIMRVAFGTFLGAPDPVRVFGDAQYVRPRFAAAPSWAFAAELDGEVVGSNFATCWGSYGFFGPLTVRPDLWDRGIASALMEPILDLFEQWQVTHAGLFTFPQSPRHVGLYRKFGFEPQHLTPVHEKRLDAAAARSRVETYSALIEPRRRETIARCRELTGSIYPSLDLEHEIRATHTLALGDTVLLRDQAQLEGFAVCHLGAGEAGSGTCYVKFAAVGPGSGAGERFERLLDAVEALAPSRGLKRVVAGVNAAREDARGGLLARGYRTAVEGVIMQRPDTPGYCRPDAYVIDDLR